jgi:hypothetical protein
MHVPETAAEPPADLVATQRDLYVLSWHPHLAPAGERSLRGRPSRREYEEVLDRYQWLGLPLEELPGEAIEPESAEPPKDEPVSVRTEERRDEFRRAFGMSWYEGNADLSLRQLAQASGMLALSVAEVAERYSDVFAWQNLRVPDLGDLADRTFTQLESDLLGGALDAWDSPHDARATCCPAPLADTAVTVCKVQETEAEVVECLEGLAALGLVESEAPLLVHRWRCIPAGDWKLFPVDDLLAGGHARYELRHEIPHAVREGITLLYVFSVSAYAETSVDEARSRLRSLGPLLGLDTSPLAVRLDASVASARPTDADVNACCDTDDSRLRWLQPTAARLVAHALAAGGTLGESLALLSRYAPLGALWTEPENSGHGDEWRDHRPTVHDNALFESDLVGGHPVGPLELLRVAARFGWCIDHAWDRVALYRLFGVELLVERPEFDAVPTWRDLILLTEYYTGSAPALTGEVTPERIAVAARELEKPTSWVHDRLSLYASMFDLVLPPDCPAEPAAMPTPENYPSDSE